MLSLLAAGALASGCHQAANSPPAAGPPRDSISDSAAREPPAFAAACAQCHADIVAHYSRSGMSHSWRRVSPQSLTQVSLPATVPDQQAGYRYELSRRGSELWQIETHQDDAGHRRERRAQYQVGSGNHALAWIADENGFLTELPAGWFGVAARWRMNPGYELKNHRFSRPVTSGCVACHATTAAPEPPASNRFAKPIADGIDCSRCHGDADAHVEHWNSAVATAPPPAAARLVHPGHLAADRANDLCLQCHLQGDVSVPIERSSPLDFQPGQQLTGRRHDFLIAGQAETLGVASHGARLLQSRCYVGSGGRLTCIHCHDPHRPASDFDAAYYDAKCLDCHQPQACSRPPATAGERLATGCVACHMPQRPTREGLHLVFTDHAMRRQPASPASAPAPPVLAANAEIELVSAWPKAAPDAATLGAAYVLLHETHGPQLPALSRGQQLLAQAVANHPADGDSRYWLGSALLALQRPAEARTEFGQVLSLQPRRHEARYRLGLAEEALGNSQGAIAEYTRLLQDAPHWPEPYVRLAQLQLAQRQPAAAAATLRKLTALQPDAAAYASLALAKRLAGASHEQALAVVNKGLVLDSRQPAVYVHRGTLWLLAGQANEALRDFERALALDPANAAAREAVSALSTGK